jgi:hypothetical protein
MVTQWLGDPTAPLLEFAKRVGIPEKALREGEELTKLVYTDEQFQVSRIANLTLAQVLPLTEAYGDTLECKLLLGGLVVLDIKPGISAQELDVFWEQVQQSPSVELELTIDKVRLAEHWLGSPSNCRPFLFFFAETLIDFLKSEPDRLREKLWGDNPACKVILFVPGRSMRLDGPYLAVLGGDAVHSRREVIPALAPDLDAVQRMHKLARETLKWLDFQLGCLTPLHLKLEGDRPADDPIANALLVHFVNLVVLYTADRAVRWDDGRLEATYAGANQTVTFDLVRSGTFLDERAQASAGWLIKIVEWAYERADSRDWPKDRLPLVQIAVCQALRSAEPGDRYRLLLCNARNIFHELQWHWKAFIEGKVDAYIAKVKDLEDYVDKTVAAFADQVSTMIDSLSKTMLVAIATVLGSFIGAIFKDKFNPAIFIIGMTTYAAYVFLFPLAYNMSHTWGCYRTLVKEFEERRRRFEEHLYADKVKEIVGQRVDESQRRFVLWFGITVGSYVAVIFLAIMASVLVPIIMAVSGP